jgi:hypothetical protein
MFQLRCKYQIPYLSKLQLLLSRPLVVNYLPTMGIFAPMYA